MNGRVWFFYWAFVVLFALELVALAIREPSAFGCSVKHQGKELLP